MSMKAMQEQVAIMRGRQAADEATIRQLRALCQMHGEQLGTLTDRILDHCDKRHCDSKELEQIELLITRNASVI